MAHKAKYALLSYLTSRVNGTNWDALIYDALCKAGWRRSMVCAYMEHHCSLWLPSL